MKPGREKHGIVRKEGRGRAAAAGAVARAVGSAGGALAAGKAFVDPPAAKAQQKIDATPSKYTVPDQQTPFAKATSYNNF